MRRQEFVVYTGIVDRDCVDVFEPSIYSGSPFSKANLGPCPLILELFHFEASPIRKQEIAICRIDCLFESGNISG
jgi:hypothetical protein